MEEAGRTDACETRREATSNSARVQWRALGEWRSEAKDATGQKGALSAESVSAQTTPEQWGMNSEGKNRMSVKGLRAPSLALAYEDWTAPQAAGPINNLKNDAYACIERIRMNDWLRQQQTNAALRDV